MISLSIHHLAPDFVVIDKPAGFRSVPARGADTDPALADSVETRVRAAFDCPEDPVTVHRLDMDTSGLMVFALNRATHRALSRQFMHRKVGKSYAALLAGTVEHDEGAIDIPLNVDWPNRPLQCVNHRHGKPARTLYRVKDRHTTPQGPRTRVTFRPITGRTHQLRVHAATPRELGGLACPVVGDPLYNPSSLKSQASSLTTRLHLHADTLAFWNPTTGDWSKFESPAPF